MPTGYTADVENGKVTDFRTFALRCARAFGATIMQRDNPLDEMPKHREVSDYYLSSVAQSEARVKELATMTEEEAEREALAADAKRVESHLRIVEEGALENDRYDAMLEKVNAWDPPTPEHVGMKDFMRDQLQQSKHSLHDWDTEPHPMSGTEWLAKQREAAAHALERDQQCLAEEVARCAQSNAWIDALYASLPEPTHVERV